MLVWFYWSLLATMMVRNSASKVILVFTCSLPVIDISKKISMHAVQFMTNRNSLWYANILGPRPKIDIAYRDNEMVSERSFLCAHRIYQLNRLSLNLVCFCMFCPRRCIVCKYDLTKPRHMGCTWEIWTTSERQAFFSNFCVVNKTENFFIHPQTTTIFI